MNIEVIIMLYLEILQTLMTRIHIVGAGTSANGYFYASLDGSIAHLDSPSSTSALTYSTKGYVSATADTCTIRFNTSSSRSTIQLIEIGA